MLAQKLKPGLLDAWVVLSGLDEVHKRRDILLKALSQRGALDLAGLVYSLVSLGQREHVRE